MKSKTTLIIIILATVILLIGAYVLYKKLAPGNAPDQLLASGQSPAPTDVPQPPNTPAASPASDAEPSPSSSQEPQVELAPDFTVYDADGTPITLSEHFGKPIVLNFWASWCGPCKSEMPDFNSAHLELGDSVQFIMVNLTDGSRETVSSASSFIAEQGYSFPVFYDTESIAANTYRIYSIPTTFFIDQNGVIAAQASGAIDADTLKKGLSYILPTE